MLIKTKYSNGDTVYLISKRFEQIITDCGFCNGTGRITGADGQTDTCPKCYGRRIIISSRPMKWLYDKRLTIGRVEVKIVDSQGLDGETTFDNYKAQQSREEKYMAIETGIGTGSVWSVENLFSTQEEAQAECDERNKDQS